MLNLMCLSQIAYSIKLVCFHCGTAVLPMASVGSSSVPVTRQVGCLAWAEWEMGQFNYSVWEQRVNRGGVYDYNWLYKACFAVT